MAGEVLAGGVFDGIGEFGGVGGGEADGGFFDFVELFGDEDAGGGVGVEEILVFFVVAADGGEGAAGVGGAGDDFGVEGAVFGEGDGEAAFEGELGHEAADGLGVLAELVEEPAFEIAGDLDVHGGVDGGHDLALGVDAGVVEAGEDVVFVGGEDEASDGEAHALGVPAGEDVAEVAGGDGELDGAGAGGFHDAEGGIEIVDDLAEDAGPVDGVDGAEGVGVLEGEVVEEGFHEELAVVEAAVDGEVEDVVVEDGRHLPFLEGADAALGVHDEDADAVLAADAGDGGGAGIAAGGGEDIEAAPAFLEDFGEEAAEELEGDVLEGEGGAMEEFEDVDVADGADGGDFGMGERGVGGGEEGAEAFFGDVVGEEAYDFEGEVGIVEVAPIVEEGGDVGDAVGDEEAAVAGEAGHDGVLEGEGRLGAAGADVADWVHGGVYIRGCREGIKRIWREQWLRNGAAFA